MTVSPYCRSKNVDRSECQPGGQQASGEYCVFLAYTGRGFRVPADRVERLNALTIIELLCYTMLGPGRTLVLTECGGKTMSMYEREWYRKKIKEDEKKRRRQEAADAMWNEVEPPRRKTQTVQSSGSQNAPQYTPPQRPRHRWVEATCPHCGQLTQGTVPSRSKSYSFKCSHCNHRVSVTSQSVLGELLSLLIVALVVVAGIGVMIYYVLPDLAAQTFPAPILKALTWLQARIQSFQGYVFV